MAENDVRFVIGAGNGGLTAALALQARGIARSTMLTTYIGNNVGFFAHFLLLSQWTAAAMNGLIGVQTIVAIWLGQRPQLRWVYYAFMPVLAVCGIIIWQGLPSLLAAATTALSAIGNEMSLRAWMLASTPFWMAHDLAVGSLPGLLADLLGMATGGSMLLKRSLAIHAAVVKPVPSASDDSVR
jgi:hypothetical protein